MIYDVKSEYNIMRGAHWLAIRRFDAHDLSSEVMVPSWVRIRAGEQYPDDALFWLHEQEIQPFLRSFADEAWRLGVKPSKHQQPDNAVVLDALKYHLEDMRRLVFSPQKEAKP